MSKDKRLYFSKVCPVMHEYVSDFISTAKDELFCKVSNSTMKCNQSFEVDLHCGKAKRRRGFLHEKASTQTFLYRILLKKITKRFFVLTYHCSN